MRENTSGWMILPSLLEAFCRMRRERAGSASVLDRQDVDDLDGRLLI